MEPNFFLNYFSYFYFNKKGIRYRTRAIINRGLYTFYPLFEVHLCTVTFGLWFFTKLDDFLPFVYYVVEWSLHNKQILLIHKSWKTKIWFQSLNHIKTISSHCFWSRAVYYIVPITSTASLERDKCKFIWFFSELMYVSVTVGKDTRNQTCASLFHQSYSLFKL